MDVNKGDVTNPNCRSRLVGCDLNIGKDDTLYAATPPLEALRVDLEYGGPAVQGGESSISHGERRPSCLCVCQANPGLIY